MTAPLLPFFLTYAAGLLWAQPPPEYSFLYQALPAGMLLAGLAVYVRDPDRSLLKTLLLALCLFLGLSAFERQDSFRPATHILNHLKDDRRAEVTGTLVHAPKKFPDRTQFLLDLESVRYGNVATPVTGRARLTLYQPGTSYRAGDRMTFFKVRLKRPRNFKNPGRFDYEQFMRSRGIDVTGGVSKIEQVQKTGEKKPGVAAALRQAAQRHIMELFDRTLPPETASLLKAMVLGEKQFLSKEQKEAYVATGMAHLLAVSGLHIGFAAGATYFLLYPLVFRGLLRFAPRLALLGLARKLTALLCMPPVAFYMVLVGEQVSAVRAGIMILIYLGALVLEREKNLFNALLLAAGVILLANPHALFSISFLLSFTAVGAILFAFYVIRPAGQDAIDALGEVPWYRRYPGAHWKPASRFEAGFSFVYGTALVSLAAILGTLPILIYFFNRVSWVSLLLNIALVPLASLIIPAVLFIALIAWGIPAVGSLLMPVAGVLAAPLVHGPENVAALFTTSFHVPTPPSFWFLLYYGVLFGAPWWWKTHRKNAGSAVAGQTVRKTEWRARAWLAGFSLGGAAVLFWLVFPRFPLGNSDTLTVYLLDVGQGESIFIELPGHETILLDGGGFYKDSLDVGRAVVGRFLWHRGLGRIDYIGATHSDHDHLSGLKSIARLFPAAHYLDRPPWLHDSKIQSLREAFMRRGSQPLILTPGEPLTIGEVRLTLLHPTPAFARERLQLKTPTRFIGNDLSWVLRLSYRRFSMLLTGDITERAERYLTEHRAEALKADVLKAPHHGSRFSSSVPFIRAVDARDVLFSSGYRNIFRHPHPETLERYRQAGAHLWRTDAHGAVAIVTDGTGYEIVTHERF